MRQVFGKINIIDCTLREGMQTKQCNFTLEQSAELAARISRFGVDMIECGHPKISTAEVERVRAVVRSSAVPVLAHSRCRNEDIDAVAATGAPWIGLFCSFNEVSLSTKFNNMEKSQVVELFYESIRYAKNLGLKVRATIEDGGRTSVREIVEIVSVACSASADRVCFADSVGMLMPRETYEVFSLLRSEFPNVEFEYHVHNDQGLALANTMEAIEAGVRWLSTSCNGIGERAGITDTFQLVVLLATKYDQSQFQLKSLQTLSEIVEVYSRIKKSPMQPFTGENVFFHASRLHQLAVKKNPYAYSVVDPEFIGGDVSFDKVAAMSSDDLFIRPFVKSSTELKYHRAGPGDRFVMIDRRLLKDSPFYTIARRVLEVPTNEVGHVDSHRHNCDSVFMFLGDKGEYSGLTVEVTIGEETRVVQSPATVFIPAGAPHSYSFIAGSGTYINFVAKGDYHQSLFEHDTIEFIDNTGAANEAV
jgi:2-isopropylmalate synthase